MALREKVFFERKKAWKRYKYDWQEEGISEKIKEIALDPEEMRKFFAVGVYIIFTAIMLRIVLIFATWPC